MDRSITYPPIVPEWLLLAWSAGLTSIGATTWSPPNSCQLERKSLRFVLHACFVVLERSKASVKETERHAHSWHCNATCLQEGPHVLGFAPYYVSGPVQCFRCCSPVSKGAKLCAACGGAAWCSSDCHASDVHAHAASGECALFQNRAACTALGSWCREASAATR